MAGSVQEKYLTVLQTAPDRLEYVTSNDWALIINRAKLATFGRGQILVKQGTPTKLVYLLVTGKVNIESAKRRIAQLGPGEICGEMSFLENSIPSATVIADEETESYAVEWSALHDLFELYPHLASRFYRSLALKLSRRLRGQIVPKVSRL